MKVKKLLALFMTGVIAMSALVACGTSNNINNDVDDANDNVEEEVGIVTDLEEPVTIEFWHAMSGYHEEVLTELTNQFNESNDMITVDLMNQGGYNDLSSKILANAKAGTLPVITQAYPNWMDDYLGLEILQPLDEYINDSEIGMDLDEFIPAFIKEGSQWEDGLQYGLPFNKSVEVMFYNKTNYEALGIDMPTNWDELEEVAKAYYDEYGVAGFGWDDEANILYTLMFQNGGKYVEDGEVLFNNDISVDALEYFVRGADEGYFRIGGEDGYLSDVLSNEQVGAYIGSSAGAAYINAEDFELGVAPVPQGGENEYTAQAGTQIVTFNTATPEENYAAYEYMKFLTEPENTAYWAKETGYVPISYAGFETDIYQEFLEEDPTAKATAETVDKVGVEPVFPGSYVVRSTLKTEIQNAIIGAKSIEEALDYAENESIKEVERAQ